MRTSFLKDEGNLEFNEPFWLVLTVVIFLFLNDPFWCSWFMKRSIICGWGGYRIYFICRVEIGIGIGRISSWWCCSWISCRWHGLHQFDICCNWRMKKKTKKYELMYYSSLQAYGDTNKGKKIWFHKTELFHVTPQLSRFVHFNNNPSKQEAFCFLYGLRPVIGRLYL